MHSTILKAILDIRKDDPTYDPRYKQGYVICEIHFYEDTSHTGSGLIEGKLDTDFYLDKRGDIFYNALMSVADSYCNNQCQATWKSYRAGITKKCNWGDYRIPDSL